MKNLPVYFFWLAIILFSCKDKKNSPDVSAIKADVKLERFDQDFFSIDTLALQNSFPALQQKYPLLLPLFVQNILGVDSASLIPRISNFIRLSKSIHDTVNIVFKNTDDLKKDFDQSFQYVKYYFPEYPVPAINTIIGPIDLLAKTSDGYSPDFFRPGFLGISLQFYLGKNFSLYSDEYFITNVAPQYRSRRFEKQYIVSDAMKLIVEDLFPDQTNGKPLIEQMIEKGKQWWLLDKFLPQTADSLKTGYTQQQLEWCKVNEGLIWNQVITNENLYTVDPVTIQTYIGESPFTQTMPEQSPGNIGPWIGRQIVKKFVANNSALTPEQVMKTDAKKILEEAKYKPK
jgi:hypothetical protein